MCNTHIATICPWCNNTVGKHKKAIMCAAATTGFGTCEGGVQTSPRKSQGPYACKACRAERAEYLAMRSHIAELQRESDKWHVCRGEGHCLRREACPKLRKDWGGPMPREG